MFISIIEKKKGLILEASPRYAHQVIGTISHTSFDRNSSISIPSISMISWVQLPAAASSNIMINDHDLSAVTTPLYFLVAGFMQIWLFIPSRFRIASSSHTSHHGNSCSYGSKRHKLYNYNEGTLHMPPHASPDFLGTIKP